MLGMAIHITFGLELCPIRFIPLIEIFDLLMGVDMFIIVIWVRNLTMWNNFFYVKRKNVILMYKHPIANIKVMITNRFCKKFHLKFSQVDQFPSILRLFQFLIITF